MHTPHPTSDYFDEALANAKITALRALLEIINTTDDESEKRQAATVIMRSRSEAPAPSKRDARPANSTPTPTAHTNHAPALAQHTSSTSEPPDGETTETDDLDNLDDLDDTDDFGDLALPNLPSIFPRLPHNAAAKIATLAGALPPQPRAGSP